MFETGCEVKRGKHLVFKIPDGKKFIRCDSLGDNYTEAAILERLSGRHVVAQKVKVTASNATKNKPSLLIDIQTKIEEGKGAGYEQWARVFNIKQSAKRSCF